MQSIEESTQYLPKTQLRYGFLKSDGTFAVEPKFSFAQAFINNIALVVRKDKAFPRASGIDKTGKILFNVENCELIGGNTSFVGAIYGSPALQVFNLSTIEKGKVVHEIIDSTGIRYWPQLSKIKCKERFDLWKQRTSEEFLSRKIDWKVVDTFFDKSDELGILDIRTQRIMAARVIRYAPVPFSCGVTHMQVTSVSDERYIVLIDENGELVARLAPNVVEVGEFSEGLASFDEAEIFIAPDNTLKFSRMGFVDTAGSITISTQFEPPLNLVKATFSEGLAVVRKDNLCGAISKDGTFVIEPKFIDLSSFENGLAVASALVDQDGRLADPRTNNYGIQNLQTYKEEIAKSLTAKMSDINFPALIRFCVDMHPHARERKILTQPSDMSSAEVPEDELLKIREAAETVPLPEWGQLIFWGDPFQFVLEDGKVSVGFSGSDPQIDLIKKYLELKLERLRLLDQSEKAINLDKEMSATLALVVGSEARKKLQSIALPTIKAFNGK